MFKKIDMLQVGYSVHATTKIQTIESYTEKMDPLKNMQMERSIGFKTIDTTV
jgi:hypothetical protein